MASDLNPQLRAELETALDALQPQIRGLHDLAATSISAELNVPVQDAIMLRERRRDRIRAVLHHLDTARAALEALESDGYPNLPTTELDAGLLEELRGQASDIEAAISLFDEHPPASSITVDLGEPADKQKPL